MAELLPEDFFLPEMLSFLYDDGAPVLGPFDLEDLAPCPPCNHDDPFPPNRSGGLQGRKLKPKIVQHHSNPTNSDRCFVEVFKLYHSLCPKDGPKDAFYLQPLLKPRPDCWNSCKPIAGGYHHSFVQSCRDFWVSNQPQPSSHRCYLTVQRWG